MLDRRVIGKNFPPVVNDIEKGSIRRFAEAVGDLNPLYRDEEAARAAGHRSLLAPPTFPSTLSGGLDVVTVLGLGQRGVLVGEQSFEYCAPICAGDRITVTSKVVDIYEKMAAGGVMDFAVVEDEGRDERGELCFRARRTLIVRPAVRPAEAPVVPQPQHPQQPPAHSAR